MKNGKKVVYWTGGILLFIFLIFPCSTLGYIIPPEDDPDAFVVLANSGRRITGSDEEGDYTDTFVNDDINTYDVKTKKKSIFFIVWYEIKIEFTFPYESSWKSEFVVIDIETPRVSDTRIVVYCTIGDPVYKDLGSNGINYVFLNTNAEVWKIIIEYNTSPYYRGGGWIKVDYIGVFTTSN